MSDLGTILLVLTIIAGLAAIIALIQFFTGANSWGQLRAELPARQAAPPPTVVQFHLPPRTLPMFHPENA